MNSWWWWSGAQVSCLCVCLCRKKMRKIILKSFKIEFISNWLKFSFFFCSIQKPKRCTSSFNFFFRLWASETKQKKITEIFFFSNFKLQMKKKFFWWWSLDDSFFCCCCCSNVSRCLLIFYVRIELNWIEWKTTFFWLMSILQSDFSNFSQKKIIVSIDK